MHEPALAEPPHVAAAAFLRSHLGPLCEAARLGPIADVACGRGRNAGAVLGGARRVIGIDRDAGALASLPPGVCAVRADLEAGQAIPLESASCGAVLVFRFLFRPLAREIERILMPDGVLLYETFTIHQRDLPYGPSNPAFLLEPQELAGLFPALETLEHSEGRHPDGAREWETARLLARKPAPTPAEAES